MNLSACSVCYSNIINGINFDILVKSLMGDPEPFPVIPSTLYKIMNTLELHVHKICILKVIFI